MPAAIQPKGAATARAARAKSPGKSMNLLSFSHDEETGGRSRASRRFDGRNEGEGDVRASIGMTLMVAAMLMPAAAAAQQPAEPVSCFARDAAPPEQKIAACTTQIDSNQLSPQSRATAFNNRGFAFLDRKQYDRAIQDFGKAIEINPDYALAFNNRGNAYRNKGRYDRAIADYDRAIALDPGNTAAFFGRALAYQSKAHWDFDAYLNAGLYDDRAIADFDQVIGRSPNHHSAFNNRGNSYFNKRQYDRAIADYDEAIRIEPNVAIYFKNRGNAFRFKGLRGRAIADFRKALALKTDGSLRKFLEKAIEELGAVVS
jgi:tetratricopeptide (TPR) repeat protein